MQFTPQVAAAILAFASSALAAPAEAPAPTQTKAASPEIFSYPSGHFHYGTAHGGALDMTDYHAYAATTAPSAGPTSMTVNIVNSMTDMSSISISYVSNTFATDTTTVVAPPLSGNPTESAFASSTQVVAPFGWGGRMTFGSADDPDGVNPAGSKAEFNFGFNGAPPAIDVDVSYVDGYTVPVVISCEGTPVSGCNIDLFSTGTQCTNAQDAGTDYETCINEPRNIHGPASPFFNFCTKSAYTYDYDDVNANSQGQCQSGVIDVCIGTPCQPPARQGGNGTNSTSSIVNMEKPSLLSRWMS